MISSSENNTIKLFRKLQKKKYRDEQQLFVVEGIHLVQEALKKGNVKKIVHNSHFHVENGVLYTDSKVVICDIPENIETVEILDTLTKQIALTQTPQGIFALVSMRNETIDVSDGDTLILDGLQDPGNAGTLIRTASAFGFKNIVFTEGTVDRYNEKLIRATQGMIFELHIVDMHSSTIVDTLLENETPTYVLDLFGENISTVTRPNRKIALIAGREGEGIRDNNWEQLPIKKVTIPMSNNVESLNVTIATSIAMFELTK